MFTDEQERVFESKFISPGINKTGVRVTSITGETPEGYSSRIIVEFEDGNGMTGNSNFSFSEDAKKYSLQKLQHMWNRVFTYEQWQAMIKSVNSAGGTVINLAEGLQTLVGATYKEFKFVGKEIEGKEGKNNWFKAELGLPDFCSTDFSPKTLTWDENSKYDMVRLLATTSTPKASSNGQAKAAAKVW